MKRQLLKDSLFSFISKMIIFALGFTKNLILTRLLGPAAFGVLSLLKLLPYLVNKFLFNGVGLSLIYQIKRNDIRIREVASAGVGLFFALIPAVLGLSFFLYYPVKWLLIKDLSHMSFLLAMGQLPFIALLCFENFLLLGMGKNRLFTLLTVVPLILSLGLIAVAVKMQVLSISQILVLELIAIILTALIGVWPLRREIRIAEMFQWQILKRLTSFALKSNLATGINYLHSKADLFLITALLSSQDLGHYALAATLAELMWFFPESVTPFLYSAIAGMPLEKSKTIVQKATLGMSAVIVGVSFLGFMAAPYFFPFFYGESFHGSIAPFQILIFANALISLAFILRSFFMSSDHQEWLLYGSAVASVLNICLNLIFIPRWGLQGAAWCSLISYGFFTLFLWISMRYLSRTVSLSASQLELSGSNL